VTHVWVFTEAADLVCFDGVPYHHGRRRTELQRLIDQLTHLHKVGRFSQAKNRYPHRADFGR
jgi:ABC-type enterochelin transport system ATPase subunit